jgi:hypothetical protein
LVPAVGDPVRMAPCGGPFCAASAIWSRIAPVDFSALILMWVAEFRSRRFNATAALLRSDREAGASNARLHHQGKIENRGGCNVGAGYRGLACRAHNCISGGMTIAPGAAAQSNATPMRLSLRQTMWHGRFNCSDGTNSVKRSGMNKGVTTSSAAPVSETLRTVQSIPPPPNSIVPAFKVRCRAAIRVSSMTSI